MRRLDSSFAAPVLCPFHSTMGVDERPLPKPPLVKFAAVVTTAAFAGHRFLPHSLRLSLLLKILTRNPIVLNIVQRQQRRSRIQLGTLAVLRHACIAVLTFHRFIKKWTRYWRPFGGSSSSNNNSLHRNQGGREQCAPAMGRVLRVSSSDSPRNFAQCCVPVLVLNSKACEFRTDCHCLVGCRV